jgi:hypothetical protein
MMFFKGYKIASPGAIVVLVCFFLPWVFVSCYGQPIAQFSGYELASGPMIQGPFGGAERADPTLSLFGVPIVGAIVLTLAYMATKRQHMQLLDKLGVVALGLLTLVAVVFSFLSNAEEVQQLANEGILIDFRIGFWGTLLGLVAVTVGGAFNWIRSDQ